MIVHSIYNNFQNWEALTKTYFFLLEITMSRVILDLVNLSLIFVSVL